MRQTWYCRHCRCTLLQLSQLGWVDPMGQGEERGCGEIFEKCRIIAGRSGARPGTRVRRAWPWAAQTALRQGGGAGQRRPAWNSAGVSLCKGRSHAASAFGAVGATPDRSVRCSSLRESYSHGRSGAVGWAGHDRNERPTRGRSSDGDADGKPHAASQPAEPADEAGAGKGRPGSPLPLKRLAKKEALLLLAAELAASAHKLMGWRPPSAALGVAVSNSLGAVGAVVGAVGRHASRHDLAAFIQLAAMVRRPHPCAHGSRTLQPPSASVAGGWGFVLMALKEGTECGGSLKGTLSVVEALKEGTACSGGTEGGH